MAGKNNTGNRKMTPDHDRPMTGHRGGTSRSITRLFHDETAVTTTEYVVAAAALALAAIAASRAITGVLIPYLHRVYLVVTLPVP